MTAGYQTNRTKCTVEEIPVIPVEIALVAGLMTLAVLFAPVGESATAALNETMVLGFVGFLMFLFSKISLFTSGQFTTWGSSAMRDPFKLSYFAGYGLMGISAAAIIGQSF